MTSSSESAVEQRVLRGDQAGSAYALRTPDLRAGTWTRLGSGAALGDVATEDTLSALAERARATAEAQGYAVGWAKGVREAQAAEQQARAEREERERREDERRETEHAAAVAALREAALRLDEARTTLVRQVAEQATDLALAVTTEVLGHAAAQQTPADVVRRALEVLPDGDTAATVRLSPAVARDAAEAGLPASVSVAVDHALSPADALVELSDHVVDLRTDRALGRVREALR